MLLESVFAVALLAALTAAIPLAVIVAAQLNGFATTGQWRGFPVSEFLDVLGVDADHVAATSGQAAGYLISLPAALVLSTIVLFLAVLAGLLHRLSRRERARFLGVQQRVLIKDIERELEMQRSGER
ncbi:MAG: hypothetical protein K2Y71_22625 [Xanthobacteraceae bacterium]|nr:hypothetical protein [Xanthobacteraceae bacterium]